MATPGRRARTTTGTCNGRRPPRGPATRPGFHSAGPWPRRGAGRTRPREPVTDDAPREARLRGQASTAPAHGHAGAPSAHDHGSLWRAATPGAAGWAVRPCPASPRGGLVGSTGLCGCTAACCEGSPQAAAPGKPGQRPWKRRGGGACPRPAPLPWGAGLERRAYSSAALTAAGSARACTWRIRRTVLPPRMALIWRSS